MKWPLLQKCVASGYLAAVDLFFAERLLAGEPEAKEEKGTLLALLMAASRLGHLCLKLDQFPLIIPEKEIRRQLEQSLQEASSCDFSGLPLHRFENCFYLQKNWSFETRFLSHLQRLLSHPPLIPVKDSQEEDKDLLFEQRQAVANALKHSVSILTGGPGTGKTYTASHIVSAFLKGIDPSLRDKVTIVLTAPTGKAAAHLEKKIEGFRSGTLHSLLNIKSSRDFAEEGTLLAADLIIVDETSMIEARLFSYFLASIKSGTRVVLMGDPDQLPPVESGSLFADLVEEPGLIPCTHLKKCMRSDQADLFHLAQAIRRGEAQEVIERVKRHRIPPSHSLDAYVNLRFSSSKNPDDFRLLSPVRKGPLGVDAWNEKSAQQFFDQLEEGEWGKIPLLITRNDYELGLCNGQTGVLFCQKRGRDLSFTREDYACFEDKRIPALLLPPFEYAYCLSVHKSQGSEYEEVLLFVPEGSEAFGREALYTAVTRARSKLEIEGDDAVIRACVERSSRKISGLRERLKREPTHHEPLCNRG